MQQKVALVTGTSSGFGSLTSAVLAENGYRTFGTSRRPSDKAGPKGVEMLQLDVDSDESAEKCVETLIQKAGRLDVLVNNAGYVLTGALEETSIEEAKAHFETNFFGAVRMCNRVLPVMRSQREGRIVNMSSLAGILPVPFEGYYAATKAALSAYSEALRHEVKTFNIRVSVVEPGFFKTNLGNARRAAGKPIEEYAAMRERAVGRLDESFQNGSDPRVVAALVLRIIQSSSPRLRYRLGQGKGYASLKGLIPESTLESGMRRHWRLDR